ncbi:unnamed protein product [Phaeothamnion confervicola]
MGSRGLRTHQKVNYADPGPLKLSEIRGRKNAMAGPSRNLKSAFAKSAALQSPSASDDRALRLGALLIASSPGEREWNGSEKPAPNSATACKRKPKAAPPAESVSDGPKENSAPAIGAGRNGRGKRGKKRGAAMGSDNDDSAASPASKRKRSVSSSKQLAKEAPAHNVLAALKPASNTGDNRREKRANVRVRRTENSPCTVEDSGDGGSRATTGTAETAGAGIAAEKNATQARRAAATPKVTAEASATSAAEAAAVAALPGAAASILPPAIAGVLPPLDPMEQELAASALRADSAAAVAADDAPTAAQMSFLRELKGLLAVAENLGLGESPRDASFTAAALGAAAGRSGSCSGGSDSQGSGGGGDGSDGSGTDGDEAAYWKEQFDRLFELRETEVERQLGAYRLHVRAREEASAALVDHLRVQLAAATEAASAAAAAGGVAAGGGGAAAAVAAVGGMGACNAVGGAAEGGIAATGRCAAGMAMGKGGGGYKGGAAASTASISPSVRCGGTAKGSKEKRRGSLLESALTASVVAQTSPPQPLGPADATGSADASTTAAAATDAATATAAAAGAVGDGPACMECLAALETKVERQRRLIHLYQMLSSVAIKPLEDAPGGSSPAAAAAGASSAAAAGVAAGSVALAATTDGAVVPGYVCTAINHIHKRVVRFSLRVPPTLGAARGGGGDDVAADEDEEEDDVIFVPMANTALLPAYMQAPLAFSAEQSPLFLMRLLQRLYKSDATG